MNAWRIPADQIIPLAERLVPLIETITYHDEYDPLDILGRGLTQEYQFLGFGKDSEITGLFVYQFFERCSRSKGKSLKICRMVLACGKGLTEEGDLLDSFCEWCKAQGCDFVEGTGRPGWVRILEPHGFTRTETTVRKPL